MKKLLYVNEAAVAAAMRENNKDLQAINAILADIKALGLPAPTTKEEIRLLIEDTAKFFESKISESMENPTVSVLGIKLKLSKKKVFQLLELPDLTLIEAKTSAIKSRFPNYTHFTIAGKAAVLDEKEFEKFQDTHSLFATTEKELELFELLDALAKGIGVYNDKLPAHNPLLKAENIANAFSWTNGCRVNPDHLQRLFANLRTLGK